ncbi:uncharacterized protein LAJ45_08258 [Morchella importuna]|uniref:uncharacterized protein n=1 Tax=Morchella importuna TaxID=1174673 RepID=UPI001E8D56EE|nr:uncharacterized protein LAJ45_08258 [Morchella importuna]KAH8147792.1 hypothetical protein LAJ45_08258 [Morchella importuna]
MTIGDWNGEALAAILKAFTLTNNPTALSAESPSSDETEPSGSYQTSSSSTEPIVVVATDSTPSTMDTGAGPASSTIDAHGTTSTPITTTDTTSSTIAAAAGAASPAVAAIAATSSNTAEAPLPILGKSRRRARPGAVMLKPGSHCAVHGGPCYCYLLVKGQRFGYMWKWTSDLDKMGAVDPGKNDLSGDGEGTGPDGLPGVHCVEEYEEEMTEMMWEVFDNFIQRRAERMKLPKR